MTKDDLQDHNQGKVNHSPGGDVNLSRLQEGKGKELRSRGKATLKT